jgi:hypothetical protein
MVQQNGIKKYRHSVDDDVTLGVYSDISQMPLLLLKEEMDKYLTWHLEE